ncbi:HAD family hydrolase [Virgibacillus alimentarius]|uniref:Cof subfamily protein (Haloacid dehalogenase superfamily) n=1 Tax=Virgibacillus alimentarius TaxID=698769 RepID=A0ABS4S8Y8_9BACI|nr:MULTISPECIES: HAD family hydrolase [Virgibacillus]MBP2257874.1 Cof subfamily protein (haloacid dehalogenase superfamily) [Virgibacillus alimentarius]HLR68303.1 HAD family hydrolase [Virgibacillus sp.]
MTAYKLLLLDIDGTILKPDHSYSESTKEAISQLQHQNMEVSLATGRPLHEIKDLAKELNITSMIGYNGAFAIYKDNIIINEPMAGNLVKKYLDIAKRNGHEMVLYTNEKNYFTSLDKPVVQKFIETFQLRYNELFTENVMNNILGITVMNVPKGQASLYELDTNLHLSRVNLKGVEGSYDVIRNNVNKGTATEKVLTHLEISKEQAIAFGDGMNDKEMLNAVGNGFAMENAPPELIPYATYTTTSVLDSGIFNGLKKLGIVN